MISIRSSEYGNGLLECLCFLYTEGVKDVRWDCGAGSLLPIEATRADLPQDFSISISSINHTWNRHQHFHHTNLRERAPASIKHILTGPTQAYHKARYDVMIARRSKGLRNSPHRTFLLAWTATNACIHCCYGKLGVQSDGVPANDFVLDGRK